ncbi:hypothetical protein ZWY2020_003716 [Hordeum vulgare]|nr:hypothetical protein ZWY2020_003716 [Hordeum vulgare]
MSVVNPPFYDDNDDDDTPLSFKRSSTSRPAPSKQEGASANITYVRSPKAAASNHQRNGINGASRSPLPLKPQFTNSNPRPSGYVQPNSSVERSQKSNTVDKSKMKRPHAEGNKSDDSDDDKPLAFRKKPDTKLKKVVAGEDEKPLASRLPTNAASKSRGSASDSEDEKPLSARFSRGTAGTSVSISNSKDKLPSNNKGLNNNSSAPRNSVKRPGSVKRESKDDDSNSIPVERKLTLGESSKSKLPVKNIVKKSPLSVKKDNKKFKTKTKKAMKSSQFSKSLREPPGSGGGKKWSTLEHNGVIFPPLYNPHGVKMLYNGQPVELTPDEEEVATMFAVMKDTEYATKKTFIDNFFGDWKKILGKNHIIKKFELCDFTPIFEWHLREKEKKKQMTSEEKKALREEKLKQEEKYMWAVVDGVREKVGNFRVEPPGLFRGRGEHPKMGKLKRRIRPSDITINIGKDTPVPECPIEGESWKEVKHDNTVTWLAFWNDPISQKDFKYVFLAASSSLKGQSDKEKYEKSRKLKDHIHNIRVNYTKDFKSKDVSKKQIAVATYLIDKLALRAGNEKDDDEADTVGCCTLKVDNVTCVPPNKLQFDFLGKDSIRYFNTVEVELPVYNAIEEFRTGKKDGDAVFDKLDTTKLNHHLKDLMPGLTAKVFRTYNASITLDAILHEETEDGTLLEKIAVYQRANKEVAIICNHQRAVSKSHDTQMTKLNEKIDELKAQVDELNKDLGKMKRGKPLGNGADGKPKRTLAPEAIEKKISQIETKIEKMEMDKKTKEDLKTVALGTSKINYLDPRITVAWCKTHEVPIEKIFSKTILAKFGWAMDVEPDFRF